ncbi:MAG TPA: hypothetical protein VLZ06_06480 [Solirubrobacteraceae bacterium]|nr:hypothetical protein [Solirubrobacteraceae bacterium]
MNVVKDYLHALEEDLRDRRMLPLVALAGVAMLGAIAFVILGGSGSGSSSPSTPSANVTVSPAAGETTGLALTPANTSTAVAETTSGTAEQHKGASRDPFALLPSAIAAETKAASAGSGSSGSSGSGESSGGSGSSGGSEPSPEGSPKSGGSEGGSGKSGGSGGKGGGSKPSKPKNVYQVSVLFGEVTGSAPAEGAGLKPYENLALLTPLPSKAEPLVVFRGVSNSGRTATFTVAAETILSGPGKCLPSAFECKAIQLKAGQNEQLQYLKPGSQSVESYELRLVSITPTSASSASLANLLSHQSKAGLEVLRRANLIAIPGLGASSLAGVLVPTS